MAPRSSTPRPKSKADSSKSRPSTSSALEEVEALRKKLAAERANISLRTTPVTAARLFATWALETSAWLVGKLVKSPVTWLLVLPAAVAWGAAKYHFAPGLFTPPVCGEAEPGVMWWVELAAKEVAWWATLGVLSSIGFGTGLHSGMMFLFPHVMQVVAASESCGTTAGLVPWYHHPCYLDCVATVGPKDGSTITFLSLWSLVTVQCMVWGVGTAMGELPPYLISKAARLAGAKDSEFQSELDEARKSTDLFSRMKIWTIDFTEKHGFLGVFLLAAWPNAAFDMCGMCCGYLLMPFWTFLLACSLGKGVVKVNGQAAFFITIFGSPFFKVFLAGVSSVNAWVAEMTGKDLALSQMLSKKRDLLLKTFGQQSRFFPEKLSSFVGKGDSLNSTALLEIYEDADVAKRVLAEWDADKSGDISIAELKNAAWKDGKISLGSLDPGAGASIFKMCWELFIIGMVLFFVVSAVNEVAKSKQGELDEARVAKLEKDKGLKKD